MKIYVVTSGCYSDYGIDAMFSTEELAEKYIEKSGGGNGDFNGVDVWTIDEYKEQVLNPENCFRIVMKENGDTESINKSIVGTFEKDCVIYEPGMFTDYYRIVVSCEARDEKHAIKIANEKRAIAIANGEMEATK